MRNAQTRSDDYFSFMEERKGGKSPQQVRSAVIVNNSFTDSDVVEFIVEPQIEVTESVISDTMIQRVFGHFRRDLPAALED
jgi:hypothetical protein